MQLQLLPLVQVLSVVAQLRDPNNGCPWDLKQTHHSLKRFLLEEAYETLTAIDEGEPTALQEELGDVLLQVLLHAQLAEDARQFTFADICETLAKKLIRRHPHVFGEVQVDSAEAVTQNWQTIKATEKPNTLPHASALSGINLSEPALSRALTTSKKAVAVGFEWPNLDSLWRCVMSEFDEFKTVIEMTDVTDAQRSDALEDEFGDILFASVNLGRHFNIDPEVALSRAIQKFTKRFQSMEALAEQPLQTLSFEQWDDLWQRAKQQTQTTAV